MLRNVFPFIVWFKEYDSTRFRADAIAGLTVALVLIPQSMAYAQLAGLPAYYGLYASLLPPMLAALFGSSRQLATGPVAVVSLLTAASLEPLASAGTPGYIAYAIALALMVGLFQFSLGILRLGLVVNFLSHPVVNGFTNAAAIIIASSQLSKMFGVEVDKAAHHYETIVELIRAAAFYIHWPTFGMGALAFAIMYGLRRISPRIPNVLAAVAVTTFLAWATGFEHNERIPMADIVDPEVHTLIREYNRRLESVPRLARVRTDAYDRLEAAGRERNALAELEARHAVDMASVKIERSQYQAHDSRERIRRILFIGVMEKGRLRLYPKGKAPHGLKEDGRTWRIRVGNGPLDPERLLAMGGGAVVGVVPAGLPGFKPPPLDVKIMLSLFPFAAIISLLGFMEAISIAKAMAGKTGQRIDPNQELIGQGLANILGAMTKSYPTSGSFSRSAVNLQSGALTGLSSVFTSLAVLVVLLFFTPLLYHLPQAVLAAVIMMAVIGLINASGFIHAWKAQWYDGLISIITFICTLAFAPHLDRGILVGVVLSLLVFLYKSMRPRVATLSRHEDQSLRDCCTFGLRECRYMALVRFDGPLFFANASYLEDKVMERMRENRELRDIIIVSNGINDIDASGEESLSLLVDRVRSAGLDISLSGVNETVMQVLKRTHFLQKIGEDRVFPTMEKAIEQRYAEAHRDGEETVCPLLTTCKAG